MYVKIDIRFGADKDHSFISDAVKDSFTQDCGTFSAEDRERILSVVSQKILAACSYLANRTAQERLYDSPSYETTAREQKPVSVHVSRMCGDNYDIGDMS